MPVFFCNFAERMNKKGQETKPISYHQLWQRLTKHYDEGEAKAIARWVLEERFGLSMLDIYSGGVESLTTQLQTELEQLAVHLEQGEPVQYVLGVAEFCGRRLHVGPGVLIPRPETEELCRWIVEESGRSKVERDNILDIGTGSGCIAITLALDMPNSKVTAWDISDEALRTARENACHLQADITFEKRDAMNISPSTFNLQPSSNNWDLIVSNPPYIDETAESDGMAKNVLEYEPHEALFGPKEEPDLFYRRIGEYAIRSLKPNGRLYFELNPLTAETVVDYLAHLGFQKIELRQDQFGKIRFLKTIKR